MDTIRQTSQKPAVLRRHEVETRTGLARSTLYGLIKSGRFPPPIPLTDSGRAVGWLESDIDAYLQNRINAARPNTTGGE